MSLEEGSAMYWLLPILMAGSLPQVYTDVLILTEVLLCIMYLVLVTEGYMSGQYFIQTIVYDPRGYNYVY